MFPPSFNQQCSVHPHLNTDSQHSLAIASHRYYKGCCRFQRMLYGLQLWEVFFQKPAGILWIIIILNTPLLISEHKLTKNTVGKTAIATSTLCSTLSAVRLEFFSWLSPHNLMIWWYSVSPDPVQVNLYNNVQNVSIAVYSSLFSLVAWVQQGQQQITEELVPNVEAVDRKTTAHWRTDLEGALYSPSWI